MKFSPLVSQTPRIHSVCSAGYSPAACLLNACEPQGSIASCKRHLWLQSLYHLKDHDQKWRKLSQRQTEQCHMDSANRNVVRSLEAPEATNQKDFMFLPFAQLFSFQTVLYNMAGWGCPKLQILHVESRNCVSGQSTWRRESDPSWLKWLPLVLSAGDGRGAGQSSGWTHNTTTD